MNFRTMSCVAGAAFIFAMLMIALLVPLQSAYVVNLDHRLVPANSAYLFGTDEMGRDMLSRFLAGGKYTILTGFTTTLLACASGYLMGAGVRIAPKWFGRPIVLLAYVCFVIPSFLLAPRWPNRLLTIAILPLFIISLIVIAGAGLTGWANCFVLGPLWGVAIAYVFQRGTSPGATAALTISVVAWAVVSHAVLDILGLGVSPPEPSWEVCSSLKVSHGAPKWHPHLAS
ncbi:hypothetical protein FY133_10990 [Agrobacterium tumefaciens]|uniref:hypothetical protein n=1 Tax=Agrobacterium tumefaciens TaxID=358 RepID=UPI000DD73203|nr:hypothetical protein [Agrobacterium tumefaciens]UXT66081.1 hypothetical protein FY133_10990 [Agrobacterium tumefaciens]